MDDEWCFYVGFGLLIISLVAIHVWAWRHPMTPEEKKQFDDETQIW